MTLGLSSGNIRLTSRSVQEIRYGNEYIAKGGDLGMDQKKNSSKTLNSSMLKSGKRTYFFDVKLSANNKKYLKITESTFEGEGKERRYNSFLLFPDQVGNFQQRLTEISTQLN